MAIPTLVELAVEGNTLALRFSEALSSLLPSQNRFIVMVNGSRNYVTDIVRLQPYDTTVFLRLSNAVTAGASVSITYIGVNGREKSGYGDIRSASTSERAAYFRASPVNNLTGSSSQAVTITSNKSALITGESALITFTFARDPGQTFVHSDITVVGGTLSSLTGTGITRTATFTANGNGIPSLTVTSGLYTDIFGNLGSLGFSGALGDGNDNFVDSDETISVLEDGSHSGNLLVGTTSPDGPVFISGFSIAGEAGPFALGTTYTVSGKGSVSISSDGSYTFSPVANYNGSFPEITYSVTDGIGPNDESKLLLSVAPVDDSFTDASETLTVAEDSGATTGNLLTGTSSVDGAVAIASFSIAGESGSFVLGNAYAISGKGSITINSNGSYSFTPAANFNGSFPVISYSVTDGSGTDDTSTLTITVSAVNDNFTDASESITVLEDSGATTGNLLAGTTSSDGSVVVDSFSIAGQTGPFTLGSSYTVSGKGGLAINSNGSYTFIPASNYFGSFPVVSYVVKDPSGPGVTSTLTVSVTAQDDAVVDASESITILEDSGATSGNLLTGTTSPDGSVSIADFSIAGEAGPFTLGSATTVAGKGSITILASGAYSFTPAANFNGSFPSITYSVSDGLGTNDTSTFSVAVTAVNDDYRDANETVAIAEESGITTGSLLNGTTSSDGPVTIKSFSVAGLSGPFTLGSPYTISGKGTLQIDSDGTYSFTPATGFFGNIPVVTYTTTDGSGLDDVSTLTLSVTAAVTATEANGYAGYAVTAVRDFNGDGLSDYVMSAPYARYGLETSWASKMYLLYGTTSGIPKITLSSLTAAQGIKISFTNPGFGSWDIGSQGRDVIDAGDLNGDGFNDIGIASNRGDSAFFVFGRSGNATAAIDLKSVFNSTNSNSTSDGFLIYNDNTNAWAGSSISAGDINGDGYSDIMVGSSDGGTPSNATLGIPYTIGNGMYFVIYGASGAGGSAAWQNVEMNTTGMEYYGTASKVSSSRTGYGYSSRAYAQDNDTDGYLGDNLAFVGDVNSDGFGDYIVTASAADTANFDAGSAYLMFGSRTALGRYDLKNLTSADGVHLKGTQAHEALGGSRWGGPFAWNGITGDVYSPWAQNKPIASLGDINGDGLQDFAIGSPGWGNSDQWNSGAGRVYVIYGKSAGSSWASTTLAGLNGTDGFILRKNSAGTSSNNQLGWSVSGGFDFNGDGLKDFVVSAPNESTSGLTVNGSVYVVYGKLGSSFSADSNLDALVTSGSATKYSGPVSNIYFGAAVSMGDLNGDGLADIAVGAPATQPTVAPLYAGRSFIFYGTGDLLTQKGTDAADTLNSGVDTSDLAEIIGGVDRIASGAGDDLITGIGNSSDSGNSGLFDVALGGAGSDTIKLVGTNFTLVDGGVGSNTLSTDNVSGLSIDLTTLGEKVKNFNRFDLSTGNNTLKIQASYIAQTVSKGQTGLFTVLGSAGDTVQLLNTTNASWSNTATTQVIDSVAYTIWTNSIFSATDTRTQLLIAQGITTSVI